MTEEVKGPRKFIVGLLELFVLLAALGSIGAYCANEYSYYRLTKIPEIGDTSLNQRGLDRFIRYSRVYADSVIQVFHAKVNGVRITLGPAKDSFDVKDDKISFIEICDAKFSTPEGIRPGMFLQVAKEKSAQDPCIAPGFGTSVKLPSGWKAESYYDVNPNAISRMDLKIDCLVKSSHDGGLCICLPCQKKNPNTRWPSDKPADKGDG